MPHISSCVQRNAFFFVREDTEDRFFEPDSSDSGQSKARAVYFARQICWQLRQLGCLIMTDTRLALSALSWMHSFWQLGVSARKAFLSMRRECSRRSEWGRPFPWVNRQLVKCFSVGLEQQSPPIIVTISAIRNRNDLATVDRRREEWRAILCVFRVWM